MARKKVIVEESESESDSETSGETIKQENESIVGESSESEDEEIDSDQKPASTRFPLDVKMQLLNELRTANKRKTVSCKIALRNLDWSTVKIEGYTTDELKACLDEILKPISAMRTFDEMLTDYEMHHAKYDLKMHPDAPKKPLNAVVQYMEQNREKIKEAMSKEFPNKQFGFIEVSQYGAKLFAKLPEEEKAKYKAQYDIQFKEYSKKKAELLKQYPDLRSKPVKTTTKKEPKQKAIEKSVRKKKELPYITPFMVFRKQLLKEGRDIPFHDAQTMYRNMPDVEKIKHIQSLLQLDTQLEKQFSAAERKILRSANGKPQKPTTAYNLFIKDLCKENKDSINKKELLKSCSNCWKTLDEKKKRHYTDLYNKLMEEWHVKMEEWIKTLPIEQRIEEKAKFALLSKSDSAKAKRKSVQNETSTSLRQPNILGFLSPVVEQKKPKIDQHSKENSVISNTSNDNLSNGHTSSPKKSTPKKSTTSDKRPLIDSDTSTIETPSPKKKKMKIISDSESFASVPTIENPSQSPKKKKDTSSIEPEPNKKKFNKEIVALFGPYPSVKTAHYFMSQKYNGKSHKIAKAYKKLSKTEKKQMYDEMKKVRSKYLKKVKKYVSKNGNDDDKLQKFCEKSRKEQEELISWHTDNGTDDDNSDDSDSS